MPTLKSLHFLYDGQPTTPSSAAKEEAERNANALLGAFVTRNEVQIYCPAHSATDVPDGPWTYAPPPCRTYWRAIVVPALALLLSTLPALAADKAPEKPRPRPAAQISVKVHPEKFNAGTPLAGKRLHLSTVTKTSCTAWIQADEDPLWTAGLSACRAALRANKE